MTTATTAKKLWLGFGGLLGLLLTISLIIVASMDQLHRHLRQLTLVEEPASAAAYELQTDVMGTGIEALRYLETGDWRCRDRVADYQRSFQRTIGEFERVAATDQARGLAQQLRILYEDYQASAEQLIHLRDQQQVDSSITIEEARAEHLQRFADLRTRLDQLLENHIQVLTRLDLSASKASAHQFVNRVSAAIVVLLVAGLIIGITTAVVVGRAVVRAEELLRVTFTSIGDAIIITDAQGRVSSLNGVAQALTAWPKEEAAGRSLTEILRLVDDNEDEKAINLHPRAIAKGKAPEMTNRTLVARDGSKRPIEVNAAAIRDEQGNVLGAVLLFRDISERRSMEEARTRRDRQKALRSEISAALAQGGSLRSILQQSAEAMVAQPGVALARIWTIKADENLLELKASAGMSTGLDGPFSRVPVEALNMGPTAEKPWPDLTRELLDDSRIRDADWARREGIDAFAGYPLIVAGRLFGLMALFDRAPFSQETLDLLASLAHPIAQGIARKQSEREKEELLASERAARSDAERAARLKDQFLAMISHELRTPLQAVMGWAAVLRSNTNDPESAAEAAEVIERNAKAQARLIDDLLDMSRIVTGKIHLDLQQVELLPVIEAAFETVRPMAEAQGVRMSKALDPQGGVVMGDHARLQQIVLNIISNAVKFTPEGGQVRVVLQKIDSTAEISVSDTGKGIAPQFLPHVFEQFRQADASISRVHGGLGLGLALVRHLVDSHGGTVTAESPGEGQGATFRVTLPLAVDALVPTEVGGHPEATAEPPCDHLNLSGITVLVVDDALDTLDLIRRILEDCEAEVFTASTGEEALEMLAQHQPHILISDIGMPGYDGYELIRTVRGLGPDRGGNTPAVALTALAGSQDRDRAIHAGYQMHLSKPVDPEVLINAVASLVQTDIPIPPITS